MTKIFLRIILKTFFIIKSVIYINKWINLSRSSCIKLLNKVARNKCKIIELSKRIAELKCSFYNCSIISKKKKNEISYKCINKPKICYYIAYDICRITIPLHIISKASVDFKHSIVASIR